MNQAARTLIVLATALASLALTTVAWEAARAQAAADERLRFDLRVEEIANALRRRMADYELVLRGVVGLFAASRKVERKEWAAYLGRLDLQTNYPGIRGIAYGPLLRQGAGVRVPVAFIYPADEANLSVQGVDIHSDALRRDAMNRARDTAEPVVSAALQLRDSDPPRSGFVMYLPVFRAAATPATLAARRAELTGFVFATFRVREMLERTVGDPPGIRLRLVDVTDPRAPVVLSEPEEAAAGAAGYERAEPIIVRGRTWRLEAAPRAGFGRGSASDRPRLVLVGGLSIGLLLTMLTWSLLNTTAHARELARRMVATSDELRESERRLALALQSSGLAMFDWDVRTGLVHLGAEWGTILGEEARPSVTAIQKLERLVHPDDLPGLRERFRQLFKGEIASYRVEHRVRSVHGDWIWIESVAEVSERDAEGRALRVTGTNADITARRALGEMKNAFLAAVSHELRTPLTGVVASLALLKEGAGGELPAQAQRFVDMAHANGERLAELINDVLDLERAESGRLQLKLERLEAGALLEEAASMNAAYVTRYNARTRIDAGAELFVTADRKRVQQVMTNLVSNAAKFSPPGGEILLRASAGADGRVVMSVADQGPGVPADFQPRMFDKFEQAEHGKGGTGLGLAICKALVERMGGRLWCESAPGKGAALLFDLPRAD